MASTNEINKNETSTVEEVKPKKRSYVRKKPLTDVFVEFSGNQLSQDDLVSKAKRVLESLNKSTEVKKFVFYIKPNEKAIYFTADGEGSGDYLISIS
ncbi:MAG: DUF6465 family protein [Oscillospiraceae bacterium]